MIKAFGTAVLNEQKEIDFSLLAVEAFDTPERQRQLNEIVHPEVILKAKREMAAARREGITLFVVDVPLLFEAGLEQHLDYTLAIVADEELRIKRAMARGTLTAEDIRRRTQLQLPDDAAERTELFPVGPRPFVVDVTKDTPGLQWIAAVASQSEFNPFELRDELQEVINPLPDQASLTKLADRLQEALAEHPNISFRTHRFEVPADVP